MIDIRGLCLSAGDFHLADLELEIGAGEYAVLMGRTGSGKTTLLEALVGLLPPTSGRIVLDGVDVTRLRPADRRLGYVPQDGALFPHLNVAGHLAFGPRFRGWSRSAVEKRVAELAELLDIAPLLARRPRGLSGGERQRVALGRALAARPSVLLLDEPLSAVDEETREGLCTLLASIRETTGVTILHVTHNSSEAARLATVRWHLADGVLSSANGDAATAHGDPARTGSPR